MLKKSTPAKTKSVLTSWFLTGPLKFALLSLVLLIGVSVSYALIYVAVTGGNTAPATWPIVTLMLLATLFCIYMLARWLPTREMDRRGFVAIDNGLTVMYYIFSVLSLVYLVRNADAIIMHMMVLQYTSIVWFWIVMVLGALAYLYILGLMLANIIAIYRRAVTMDVPRWKVLLSLPFTFGIYWFPGYMLPDETPVKSETPIRAKWYAAITDWVLARPVNAVLVFLLTILICALFFDFYTLMTTVVLGAIFGIWLLISGVKTFRAKMGGAFATTMASLNIAMILVTLGLVIFAPQFFTPQIEKMTDAEIIQMIPADDMETNNM